MSIVSGRGEGGRVRRVASEVASDSSLFCCSKSVTHLGIMSVVKSVDVRASKMIEKKKTFILVFKNSSQIVQPVPAGLVLCCCVAKLQELDYFGLLARFE